MAGSWVRAKLHKKEGAVCSGEGWKVHLGLEPGNFGAVIFSQSHLIGLRHRSRSRQVGAQGRYGHIWAKCSP